MGDGSRKKTVSWRSRKVSRMMASLSTARVPVRATSLIFCGSLALIDPACWKQLRYVGALRWI
jgi:hypothetical protein